MQRLKTLGKKIKKALPGAEPKSSATAHMQQRRVQCIGPHGLHHMAYTEWGDQGQPNVLLCVHGLTRNGRDFDFLANALQNEFRVICPDIIGRGQSDWLDVKANYNFSQYVNDMLTLIARLDVENVYWLGTSMGGIIGMLLAAYANTPIRKLILNDVGAVIRASALQRIGEQVGRAPRFASVQEGAQWMHDTKTAYGLSRAQWQQIAQNSLHKHAEGYTLAYDPALGDAFRLPVLSDIVLWPTYENITCPTLVVRGEYSDMLERETLEQMKTRGPHPRTAQVPAVGHAPMFMNDEQVELVRGFLHEKTANAKT